MLRILPRHQDILRLNLYIAGNLCIYCIFFFKMDTLSIDTDLSRKLTTVMNNLVNLASLPSDVIRKIIKTEQECINGMVLVGGSSGTRGRKTTLTIISEIVNTSDLQTLEDSCIREFEGAQAFAHNRFANIYTSD